jgi:S-adenosylmethionine/arginine decarboxylase-like enzyme
MDHLNHKHVILTASLRSPPTQAAEVEEWLKVLVGKVDMQILFGPYCTRCDTDGNEGVTGVVCIETSHASIHVWDKIEQPFMKFDLYSCKDFSTDTIFEHMSCFDPISCDYIVLDRNEHIRVIDQGVKVF